MKRYFAFFGLIIIAVSVNAQIINVKSSTQILIEKCLKDAMYIVSQEYQLKDTISGQCYGRNNQKNFNRIYSLGVIVDSCMQLNERALMPYKYDREFDKYKEKFQPVLSDISCKRISEKQWDVFKKDSLFDADKSLESCKYPDNPLKWVVLVSYDTNQDISEYNSLDLDIYSHTVGSSSDSIITIHQPQGMLLGGIIVTPEIEKVGKISFKVSGILYSGDDGRWKVKNIVAEKKKESSNQKADVSDLTLITDNTKDEPKKKNKKKK